MPFTLVYIDAFAGTGYRSIKNIDNQQELMFPDLAGGDAEDFHTGSARIALEVTPGFAQYVFIEQDAGKCAELKKLKAEFPDKAQDIYIFNEDANVAIKRFCEPSWKNKKLRAVLFLDPFGMNVAWQTIEAIAKTEAIDMWYLFPLGIGVNRLLTKDGKIPDAWQRKLDSMFGSADWKDIFYKTEQMPSLFGDYEVAEKTAGFQKIADYFVERLKSIFAGVAKEPLLLYNSRGNPLYLLCFACGNKNEKAKSLALKIAGSILKGK